MGVSHQNEPKTRSGCREFLREPLQEMPAGEGASEPGEGRTLGLGQTSGETVWDIPRGFPLWRRKLGYLPTSPHPSSTKHLFGALLVRPATCGPSTPWWSLLLGRETQDASSASASSVPLLCYRCLHHCSLSIYYMPGSC